MINFKTSLACDITPPPPELLVRELSLLSSTNLHHDYIEFLAKIGEIERNLLVTLYAPSVAEEGAYLDVAYIYTVSANGGRDVVEQSSGQIARDMFEIGMDAGGNQYVMSTAPSDFGYIYYLDFHEFSGRYEFGSPEEHEAARKYPVADSFTRFLEALRCDDTDEDDPIENPEQYGEEIAWASLDGVTSES